MGVPRLVPDRQDVYVAADPGWQHFSVRLEVCPLPADTAARSHVNTVSGRHVIQLSDRVSPQDVELRLRQELRVLAEVCRRAALARAPSRARLLRPGPLSLAVPPRLSDDDLRLLTAIDHLAGEDQTAQLSCLIDDAGLRVHAPADADPMTLAAEESAVRLRWGLAASHLGTGALARAQELARPVEALPPADAEVITDHRAGAGSSAVVPAVPGRRPDGRLITRQELPGALAAAHRTRQRRSAETMAALRAETADGGLARRKVMIGGGASLVARGDDTLLINARGRWHLDPISAIVQSADLVRHLYDSGVGDPYQFAGPRDRVPVEAIHLWQDTLAARGPLIDGVAGLVVSDDGQLIAEIEPADGSPAFRIGVDGEPLIATGVPAEMVPGCSRDVPTVEEAVDVLADHLSRDRGPAGARTAAALRALPGGDHLAEEIRALLRSEDLKETLISHGGVPGEAYQTIEATSRWQQARAAAPGRACSATRWPTAPTTPTQPNGG